MAGDFGALTDHFSIATANLILVDSSLTPKAESVAEALDENGDLAARSVYGNDGGTVKDASCTYALISGSLNLNTLKIGELDTGVVATSISAETSNGSWPQIKVDGILGTAALQSPSGKLASATLPSLTITGTKSAQLMSFTLGAGCKLTGCSFSVSADTAQQDDGLGEPAAYSIGFNNPPEIKADFVRVTAQPSWTPTGALTETQAPSTVEPQAAYHTSTATGVLAALTRDSST